MVANSPHLARRRSLGALATGPVRRAARHRRPAVRPEWSSFITRCVVTWLAAGASATAFLARWTPLGLPAYGPTHRRHERGRRQPLVARRSARRPARYPAALPLSSRTLGPLAAAGSPEALRRRYPLVNALLIELSAMQRRGIAVRYPRRHG